MKRCASLGEIDYVATNSRKGSRDPGARPRVSSRVYRGRLSQGRGLLAGKVGRKKNKESRFLDFQDDLNDLTATVDTLRLPQSPSSTSFLCLPVIQRESSSTSSDGRLSSDNYFPTDVLDARTSFYYDLAHFLSDDRSAKTKNVKVKDKKELYVGLPQTRQLYMGKQHYKEMDVLWLSIKAYFSGKDIYANYEMAVQEVDSQLFTKRKSRWTIIDKIMEFSTIPFPLKNNNLEAGYMKHVSVIRNNVREMLDQLERYQSLFPSHRSMNVYITDNRDAEFARVFMERVDVLTAWLNTVDDMENKLEMLGEIFEVSPDNSENLWPRSMLVSNKSTSLDKAKPIFKAFVEKSLTLRGMKKVLVRVWHICHTSLIKAAILLDEPPRSYAQAAASGSKSRLPLNDDMKSKFDPEGASTMRFGRSNGQFKRMNLPSFVPFFHFLLGIRMELILEWLKSRRSSHLTKDDNENRDSLTLEAMKEDCRDCFEEAVRAKIFYKRIAAATSIISEQYSEEYDIQLKFVFETYLEYLSAWCQTVLHETKLVNIVSQLEKEWKTALDAGRYINSGVEILTSTFTSIFLKLVDTFVLEYWEGNVECILEEHSTHDIQDIMDDFNTETDHPNEIFYLPSRAYNGLVLEIKERFVKISTLFRGTFSCLNDAFGCRATVPNAQLLHKLMDHYCLITLDDESFSIQNSIFVDVSSADCAKTMELLISLCQQERSSLIGHLVIFPDNQLRNMWTGRCVKLSVGDEGKSSLRHLRSDIICIVGLDADKFNQCLLSSILAIDMTACSSNDIIDSQLRCLSREFVSRIDQLCEVAETMWKEFEAVSDRRIRESMNSTLLKAFGFIFQVLREAFRLINDSGVREFGHELLCKFIHVSERWVELLIQIKPTPIPNVPLWASDMFAFFGFISELRWTSMLEEDEFNRFVTCVNKSRSLLILDTQASQADAETSTQKKKRYKIAAVVRSPSSSTEKRREQLIKAANKVDEKLKQKNLFQLGHVLEVHPDTFTLSKNSTTEPKWQILKKIGSGTTADVFRALSSSHKCIIAVKKMRIDNKMLQVVEREIDIFRNLKHDNLVRYYDYQVVGSEVHLAMEYCQEGTLERICSEVLDMSLVRRYTNSLLQAIAYIHKHKVVHRDIKPANIFLDSRYRLKLGDFGCSIRLREAATVLGELAEYVGTPEYMAPEVQTYGGQLEGGGYVGYGRAVDIWSLGCVVLQMMTGKTPWQGLHRFQITMKVCEREIPTIPSYATEMVKDFLLSCFRFEPDQRSDAETLLLHPFANIHVDGQSVIGN